MNLDVVLHSAAAICFGLAVVGVPSRVGLVPLGLLLWVLTEVVAGWVRVVSG